MKKVVNVCDRIVNLVSYLGIAAITGMMLLVVVNIVTRKVFNMPILGVVELTQQLLVCVVWFGMGYCALDDGMMSVDILKVSPAYMTVIRIITLITCVVSGGAAVLSANASRAVGAATTQLGIPKCIFQYVTGIGFFMIAIAIAALLIRERTGAEKSDTEDGNEAAEGANEEVEK